MAQEIIDCDVVIQAGHENTPDDRTGGEGPLGREIDWTPIVANEAVRLLKEAGVKAVKETAHIKLTRQKYRCKLALFVHFDDPDRGEAGPSVGYDHPSDADAAQEWKTLYKEFFPFNDTWLRDNATPDENHYYGFQFTVTSDAEFVVELGDLGSLRQAKWLKPRLKWLGQLMAYFVSHRIGKGGLQKPAAFVPTMPMRWSRMHWMRARSDIRSHSARNRRFPRMKEGIQKPKVCKERCRDSTTAALSSKRRRLSALYRILPAGAEWQYHHRAAEELFIQGSSVA
jgi:hypothetical protein